MGTLELLLGSLFHAQQVSLETFQGNFQQDRSAVALDELRVSATRDRTESVCQRQVVRSNSKSSSAKRTLEFSKEQCVDVMKQLCHEGPGCHPREQLVITLFKPHYSVSSIQPDHFLEDNTVNRGWIKLDSLCPCSGTSQR